MNLKVLAARKNARVTQVDLAVRAGIDKLGIILIERYGWLPPKDIREKLAQELRTTEDALFGDALRDAASEHSHAR